MGLIAANPVFIVYLVIILAVSIGLHEYAHAISSYKLGDPTPKLQNRLTPNPLAHIDPLGFIMIFFIMFGRGKPVEVNPSYYKNPLRDELIVALAGPFTNILLAILAVLITTIYLISKGSLDLVFLFGNNNIQASLFAYDMVTQFWTLFAIININLAIFNLIPIPPLDGYRLVMYFDPKLGYEMKKNTIYIFPIFLLFLFYIGGKFIPVIGGYIFEFLYSIIFYIFI